MLLLSPTLLSMSTPPSHQANSWPGNVGEIASSSEAWLPYPEDRNNYTKLPSSAAGKTMGHTLVGPVRKLHCEKAVLRALYLMASSLNIKGTMSTSNAP